MREGEFLQRRESHNTQASGSIGAGDSAKCFSERKSFRDAFHNGIKTRREKETGERKLAVAVSARLNVVPIAVFELSISHGRLRTTTVTIASAFVTTVSGRWSGVSAISVRSLEWRPEVFASTIEIAR